jgi:hypothetical protein
MRHEPVRSLWIGDVLPEAQRACISSFIRIGHPFELFTYGPLRNLPEGVKVRPGEEIVPKDRIFTYAAINGRGAGGLGGFSNLFRYALLLREGGYWVDADTFCLRPFPSDSVVISSERQRDGQVIPNCGVLKFPVGHPFAELCFSIADRADAETLTVGTTGPALVSAAVERLGLQHSVVSADVFCLIDWFEHERLTKPGTISGATLGIHLWGERWRRAGTPIPWPGPPGSLLRALADRLGLTERIQAPPGATDRDHQTPFEPS